MAYGMFAGMDPRMIRMMVALNGGWPGQIQADPRPAWVASVEEPAAVAGGPVPMRRGRPGPPQYTPTPTPMPTTMRSSPPPRRDRRNGTRLFDSTN